MLTFFFKTAKTVLITLNFIPVNFNFNVNKYSSIYSRDFHVSKSGQPNQVISLTCLWRLRFSKSSEGNSTNTNKQRVNYIWNFAKSTLPSQFFGFLYLLFSRWLAPVLLSSSSTWRETSTQSTGNAQPGAHPRTDMPCCILPVFPRADFRVFRWEYTWS